jgi:hypothetical protein
MIPEDVVSVVHGPVVPLIATRDARLRPHFTLARGLVVSADRERLTVYVAEGTSAQLIADLADNGEIAVTAGHPGTHEAYQFKGRANAPVSMTREDEAVQSLWLEKLLALVQPMEAMGLPQLFSSLIRKPGLKLAFEPREIFEQTPGPRAGAVLYQAR